MDVLTDAITVMRTGRPHSARTEHGGGRWAVRHPPFAGAGFHVVLGGSCRLSTDDGTPAGLGAGDVVFLPHGSAHTLSDGLPGLLPVSPTEPLTELRDQAVAGSSVVMLCGAYLLDGARPHPLLNEMPPVVHMPARIGQHASLRTLVDLLGTELTRPAPGADAVVSALLDALLVHMVRAWLDQASDRHPATGWSAALADPAIAAALDHLHADPARHWSVAELAAVAGLSRSAFARRFSDLIGRPPLTYLGWWRMTLAAKLLRETDLPLSSLAKRTGYTSEYAFANAFKREYGIAPGRYRASRLAFDRGTAPHVDVRGEQGRPAVRAPPLDRDDAGLDGLEPVEQPGDPRRAAQAVRDGAGLLVAPQGLDVGRDGVGRVAEGEIPASRQRRLEDVHRG
jgi:AraC-like DNA-binding protein